MLRLTRPSRCRANSVNKRQSGPDYGPGFQVKVPETFQGVPSSLGSGGSIPAGNGHLKTSRPELVPARPKVCTSHVHEPLRFPKNYPCHLDGGRNGVELHKLRVRAPQLQPVPNNLRVRVFLGGFLSFVDCDFPVARPRFTLRVKVPSRSSGGSVPSLPGTSTFWKKLV